MEVDLSASNSPVRQSPSAASRPQAAAFLRGASACISGVISLLGRVPSEIIDALADFHLSHHSHRFVVTEQDTFAAKRDGGARDGVQAKRAGSPPN